MLNDEHRKNSCIHKQKHLDNMGNSLAHFSTIVRFWILVSRCLKSVTPLGALLLEDHAFYGIS